MASLIDGDSLLNKTGHADKTMDAAEVTQRILFELPENDIDVIFSSERSKQTRPHKCP